MKKVFFTSMLTLLLFACNESKSENNLIVENVVDKTDSSFKGSFESSRDGNMIDKIYYELIKNDKKLTAIDVKIVKTYDETTKVLSEYNDVLYKSESYYREAQYETNSITDSILKHQVENEIKTSSNNYDLKVKSINNLISQLHKNNEKMNNLYTAFKIRKTLPEIEKYQNAHPLKANSLENFINKQNQLLNELKNLKID